MKRKRARDCKKKKGIGIWGGTREVKGNSQVTVDGGLSNFLTLIFFFFQSFLCLPVNIESFKNVQQWWDIFKGSYFGKGHCFSNTMMVVHKMERSPWGSLSCILHFDRILWFHKFILFAKVAFSRIWLYCGSGTKEKNENNPIFLSQR